MVTASPEMDMANGRITTPTTVLMLLFLGEVQVQAQVSTYLTQARSRSGVEGVAECRKWEINGCSFESQHKDNL